MFDTLTHFSFAQTCSPMGKKETTKMRGKTFRRWEFCTLYMFTEQMKVAERQFCMENKRKISLTIRKNRRHRSFGLFSSSPRALNNKKKHHRCVSYRRNLFFSIYPSLVGFALYTPACWLYERYRPWDTWERENAEKVFLVLAQWRWRFNDGKIFWGEMCVFL